MRWQSLHSSHRAAGRSFQAHETSSPKARQRHLDRPPDALTADLMKQQPLVTVGRLFSKVAGNAIIAGTRSVIFHRQKSYSSHQLAMKRLRVTYFISFKYRPLLLYFHSFGDKFFRLKHLTVIWVTKRFEPLGFQKSEKSIFLWSTLCCTLQVNFNSF